jgi:hypothetical protein
LAHPPYAEAGMGVLLADIAASAATAAARASWSYSDARAAIDFLRQQGGNPAAWSLW